MNVPDLGIQQLAASTKSFSDVWRDVPGIRSARLNLATWYCTVEYDVDLIPFSA
jgi:hypothetical protein